MGDYPEVFRALDEGVSRAGEVVACLDPYCREVLGIDESKVTRYDQWTLTKDLKGHDCYTFTLRISVRDQ